MRALIERWDRFWFAEVDARSLAGMRIALGLLLIVWHVFYWPDLDLLSNSGPIDTQLLDEDWTPWRLRALDGLSDPQLQTAHVLILLVLIAFTAGFGTPVMGVLALFALAAMWHRSPWIQNGGDRLLRIWLLTMAITPCGRAWSVDAWLRGTAPGATVPVYGHRLVQIQLVVMYTYTGIAKLTGHTWLDGTAVYYSWSDYGYARWPAMFDALLTHGPVRAAGMALTWATLVWEIFFGPLVLWRRTRMPTLIAGLILHAGIFATLSVGIFSWSTVWAYLAWLDPGWAARLADRFRRRT
jgi:hypothetical protein